MSKDKRYVVQMEMYVYAENDYMARKRAHRMKDKVNSKYVNANTSITELGEQPFATMQFRKLEDSSQPLDNFQSAPLPF